MPKISKEKIDKIKEHILHHLFEISPQSKFTSDIAKEIARDEEFTKSLMLALKEKKLVSEINKNPNGADYTKRQRWSLSSEAYSAYSRRQ